MKADKLLEELTALATSIGYTVRRESGSFKGGACVMKEQQLILVNRSIPPEASCVMLARALARIGVEDSYAKPAVRDILERERIWVTQHPEVTFEAS
ncbi:MAG: hypothetical protein J5I53_04695 [Bradyrhizobiaceae bacterium]|nr:hypothetical protein [Bradyrhizobiaceae bacterium]